MFFGLFGCGSRQTPEQAAQRYLERKYSQEFVIEELQKKEGGPFGSRDYCGFAYETGKPLEKFVVWVDGTDQTVRDAYACVVLLPAVNEWVQTQAEAVWPQASTAVILEPLTELSGTDYGPDEYETFLREEVVAGYVYLVVDSDDISAESYCRFDAALREHLNGYVRLCPVSGTELQSVNMADVVAGEPECSISIGSSENVIRSKLQGLGGN